MEIETRLAEFTVSEVLPVTEPNVAEILVLPTFLAVARPLTVIEAIPTDEDCHLATPVTSCVVPSENVATALYCCVSPRGSAALAGVTAIETTVAEVTVSTAVAEIEPEAAVMVVLPAATPCANPLVGIELLTVPTPVFEEVQATVLVTF